MTAEYLIFMIMPTLKSSVDRLERVSVKTVVGC